MKPCDENCQLIALYLDDELREQELADFESHLTACADCRTAVEEERRFLDGVQSAHPLYSAPPELRLLVENMLREMPGESTATPQSRRPHMRAILQRILTARPGPRWPMLRTATALGVFAAILGGLWVAHLANRRSNPHSEFAAMAVAAHKLHLKGKLPLEIRSASPAVISDWVNARAAFKMHLPSYDQSPTQAQLYGYEGARLVSFRSDSAAYVAYHTGGKPVSLVALPTSIAPPLRGKGVPMKSLTIYYDMVDGFHVMTWSGPRSRLTYALVTDLDHPAQSCIICHASSSPKDRDLMQSLRTQ
jgi:anti-sigma factor RsiW